MAQRVRDWRLPFPVGTDLASTIHVVGLPLDEAPAGAAELLDDDERARAARFVFERDRRRFVTAHAWVRIAIGSCVDRPPESLRFSFGPRGKPHLVGAGIDLRFNLSHAGERAAIALTVGRDVGVDIEQERPIEAIELARRFFSRTESEQLCGLPPNEQRPAFFRCWTRKEAFIKARGDGLAFPLDGFSVSLRDDDSTQLLEACPAAPEALQQWRLVSASTKNGYAAAVAAHAGDWRIVQWHVGHDA